MSAPDSSVPLRPPAWIAWASAALLLFAALFFAAKSFNVRNELQLALVAEQAARLEAGTLNNLLEAERILSRAQLDRLAGAEKFISELQARTDLSRLAVSTLALPEDGTVVAAVVVWSADLQQGLVVGPRIPPTPTGQHLHIWLKTPTATAPILGGTLAFDSGRASFKPAQPVTDTPTFIITLDPHSDISAPEGPVLLQN